MKYCSKCGKELMDEAVVCPHCGCAAETPKATRPVVQDTVSAGLCVLAALIPLFGIIYWAVQYKVTPKRAKAVGITAIVALVVCIVIVGVAQIVEAASHTASDYASYGISQLY